MNGLGNANFLELASSAVGFEDLLVVIPKWMGRYLRYICSRSSLKVSSLLSRLTSTVSN